LVRLGADAEKKREEEGRAKARTAARANMTVAFLEDGFGDGGGVGLKK
jgi:hypothetical protein